MILTYRYRIKDATTGKHLDTLARSVNRVWNYCGEVHEASRRYNKRWPSGFDMIRLTTGSGAMLGLHSDTVQAVCKQFVSSRDLHRRRPHWRSRKSLGWVPFAAARAIKMDGDAVIHLKRRYRFWDDSRPHAKIVNARRHHLHERSTALVRDNRLIVVGDVNARKMTQTRMAKSVLDASWSGFRSSSVRGLSRPHRRQQLRSVPPQSGG